MIRHHLAKFTFSIVAAGFALPSIAAENSEECRLAAYQVRSEAIAARCTGKIGQPKRDCETRINDTYFRAAARCLAREQQANERLQGQAQQRSTTARMREQ